MAVKLLQVVATALALLSPALAQSTPSSQSPWAATGLNKTFSSQFSFANITALFRSSLSPDAQIISSSSANWTEDVTQRWTQYGAPTYYAAIKPAVESDIPIIMKIATENNISFLATGAGHSVTTTTVSLTGIQIDLSNFNSIKYDNATTTVTIGAAVHFVDVVNVLQENGKEIQIGSAQCVGMVGATLGGGIGRLQGLHGLILDALLEVRLITASGQTVMASETENSDLFWALRGGGFNFGIVMSATYQVYDASYDGTFLNADFQFAASENSTVFELLNHYDTILPPKLSLTTNIIYNATAHEPQIVVNGVYAGSKEEGLYYLEPFLSVNAIRSNFTMVPYPEINEWASFGIAAGFKCQGKGYFNLNLDCYALGLKQTDIYTWERYFTALADFFPANPVLQGVSTTIQRFGNQAPMLVPDDETAYGHREVKAHILWINPVPANNATVDLTINTFMRHWRSEFQATSGFPELKVYVNYAHGDESAYGWYTERKVAKLIPLKKQWDPNGLFSWTNPIPTSDFWM